MLKSISPDSPIAAFPLSPFLPIFIPTLYNLASPSLAYSVAFPPLPNSSTGPLPFPCSSSSPQVPSFLSPLSTLLHWGDFWHAPAPSLPCPGLDGFLLPFSIILLVGPIHLLLQISSGASHAAALEELPRAELGAEGNEGEALAALLPPLNRVLHLNVFVSI